MRKTLFTVCSIALLGVVGCSTKPTDSQKNISPAQDGVAAVSPVAFEELETKVGNKIFFAFNSTNLSKQSEATLDKQVEYMKKYSHLNFVVEGHCDKRGTVEYNLALGERRANSVKEYLVKHGINPDRIIVISFGKERPAVIGDSEEDFAKNRRAVTVIR